MSPALITVERLQARADQAGVQLDPEQLTDLAQLMEISLAPLRRLDPQRLRSLDPLVICVLPCVLPQGKRDDVPG